MKLSKPIAILEDSLIDLALIEELLLDNNLPFLSFKEGNSLLAELQSGKKFSLLLLDWEMPGTDGLDVLQWIKTNLQDPPPAIFVTNQSLDSYIVLGLRAGASDYITKPVRPKILIARIEVQLRNSEYNITKKNQPYSLGIFSIDTNLREIKINNEIVKLPPKEFDLANLFFSNPGRLFSREEINIVIWGRQIPITSRTLDTHLSNIRKKLRIGRETNTFLNASYTIGYRLELINE